MSTRKITLLICCCGWICFSLLSGSLNCTNTRWCTYVHVCNLMSARDLRRFSVNFACILCLVTFNIKMRNNIVWLYSINVIRLSNKICPIMLKIFVSFLPITCVKHMHGLYNKSYCLVYSTHTNKHTQTHTNTHKHTQNKNTENHLRPNLPFTS